MVWLAAIPIAALMLFIVWPFNLRGMRRGMFNGDEPADPPDHYFP
jgi:hypothetical protein